MPARTRAPFGALAAWLLAAAGFGGEASRRTIDGLPVFTQETDAGFVTLRAYVRAGRTLAPAGREELADLTAAWLLLGGSQSWPAGEFDEARAALGANMKVAADRDLIVAELAVGAGQLHPGIRLFADMLMYPAFAPGRESEARAVARRPRPARDRARAQALGWMGLAEPEPAAEGSPRRTDVAAFHREHFGVNRTVLVLSGALRGIDIEREVRAAFLGFRRVAEPPANQTRSGRAIRLASVAEREVRPGETRVLLVRGGLARAEEERLEVLVGLLALAPAAWHTRIELTADGPDLILSDALVSSERAPQLAREERERVAAARAGRLPAPALERAREQVRRLLAPGPEDAESALKHAWLEALGLSREDPAARSRRIAALDGAAVARSLASRLPPG